MPETTTAETSTEPTEAASQAADHRFSALLAKAAAKGGEVSEKPSEEKAESEPAKEPEAAAEPDAAPPSDDPKARSWAEITRKEREVREQADRLKAASRELEDYRRLREARERDPLEVLQALGIDQTRMIDAIIAKGGGGDHEPAPEAQLLKRIEAAEQRIDASKAEWVEQRKILKAIGGSNAELVKLALDGESGDRVMEEILQEAANDFVATKRRPDYSEIIARIESKYERDAFSLLEFLGRSEKMKGKLAGTQQPAAETTNQKHAAAPSKKPPATLTNDLQAIPPRVEVRRLTLEEKRAAFVDAIRKGKVG